MVHGHRFPAGQAVIAFEIGSILTGQIEAIVWTQDDGIRDRGIGLSLADTARPVGRA